MRKHGLSPRGLRMLMQMLVEKNAFEPSELSELSPLYKDVANLINARRFPRVYVPAPIAFKICSYDTAQVGFVRDVSETGVRVAGIKVKVGEEMTLSMPLTEFETRGPLEFRAVCRWCTIEGKRKKYAVGGFEIVDISSEARVRLAEVIDYIHSQMEQQEATRRATPSESGLFELGKTLVVDRASRAFSGTVDGVDILEVVQLLLLNGKKMLLSIRSSKGRESVVHLRDGKVVHAVNGELEGKEAFYSSMSLLSGQFKTLPWSEPNQETIDIPGESLLLEAARRRDDPGSAGPS